MLIKGLLIRTLYSLHLYMIYKYDYFSIGKFLLYKYLAMKINDCFKYHLNNLSLKSLPRLIECCRICIFTSFCDIICILIS